jgi:hypothetical protein
MTILEVFQSSLIYKIGIMSPVSPIGIMSPVFSLHLS